MPLSISGPISVTDIQYGNIRFILFADEHLSFEGTCIDMECSTASKPIDNPVCYTVDGTIVKIISEANNIGRYVDIYLESPFAGAHVDELLKDEETGPLPKANKLFHYCLYDPKECPFKNTRFHYVDMRRTPDYPISVLVVDKLWIFMTEYITRQNADIFLNGKEPLEIHLFYYQYVLTIATFLNTDRFIDSNMWQYYRLCIESDDFINDTEMFLNKLLPFDQKYIQRCIDLLIWRYQGSTEYTPKVIEDVVRGGMIQSMIKDIHEWLLYPFIIVKKHGRVMHKLRAQLLGLELQGDLDRAESIKQFIYREISQINISRTTKVFFNYQTTINNYIVWKDPKILTSFPFNSLDIDPLLRIDVLMVDLYTLARMFRKYPVEYRTKNKSLESHILPHYIIEYAGKYHTQHVVKYLSEVGANVKIYNSNMSKRCVSVPDNFFQLDM